MHDKSVVVNTRSLRGPMTGVQRYTSELLKRWNGRVREVEPARALHGLNGHCWEQLVLPNKINGDLLFSPSNTGPIAARNQVVTIHDTSSFDYPMLRNRMFGSWYRWLQPRLANRVAKIVTVSQFAKGRIMFHLGVPESRVIVIPNGVDRSFNPEAVSQIDRVIATLKFPSPKYLVSVGTIEPCKNQTRLLEAWKNVQDRISSDVWLVLVGLQGPARIFGGPGFETIPKRVFLAGQVGELMPAVYAGAIACIQVSIYDSFGLPALEAMACGTPILASNVAALPEVVGDAALLVDPFSVDSIAAGIQQMAGDHALRERLRRKGLQRSSQFSWDETARKTWDVLQMVAAGN